MNKSKKTANDGATKKQKKQPPKEKGPTIPLEFLAELGASLLGNMHLFFGIRSTGDVLIRVNEIAADPKQYDAGVERYESQMQTAIELTSWLGAAVPSFSDKSAEKRIHMMYAMLRALFFEAPWPANPRIDPARKTPTPMQNKELIDRTLHLLQNVHA